MLVCADDDGAGGYITCATARYERLTVTDRYYERLDSATMPAALLSRSATNPTQKVKDQMTIAPVVIPVDLIPKHDVTAVAALTGLSEATVRRKAAIGWPHTRYGRALRFSDRDLLKILDACGHNRD